jgi:hypothetical protein
MAVSRETQHAGRFYPADPTEARETARELFLGLESESAVGAISPHAGWVFSGGLAAQAIQCLADYRPKILFLFGAAHRRFSPVAAVYPEGSWKTPLGELLVADDVVTRLPVSDLIAIDPRPHAAEHSLEVLAPLIKYALPDVRIVATLVQPQRQAAEIGRMLAELGEKSGKRAAYLASTDLTHYGPAFGFEPAGHGEEGLNWAKQTNDRRFIDAIHGGDVAAVIDDSIEHQSACGGGAVAALLSAMRDRETGQYIELAHATSLELAGRHSPDQTSAVSYHAGIFPAK